MENKTSWKEAIQLNYRAFTLVYQHYPQMVLSRICYMIWIAITPYVGVYLSALMIEELIGAKNLQRLKVLIFLALLSSAVISLISALLNKWKNVQNAGYYYKIEKIYTKKLFDMDFIDIDNIKIHDLLTRIRDYNNGSGYCLQEVLFTVEEIISAIFTILGGIALTISLFTSKVSESAGYYTILNQPFFIVIMLVIMLVVAYISPILGNKPTLLFIEMADELSLMNRFFGHFGHLGHKSEKALDVRMYRQDIICEKYNMDKEGTFGSQGILAKKCKGMIGFYVALSAALSIVITGVVYVFVCLKAWAGAFGIGAVTQYVASTNRVANGVSSLITKLEIMKNSAVFLKKVFEFFDIPNTMYQGSLTVEKRRDREYEVEFRNVSFKYPNSETYALKHVNMKFKVGNRLAVVGMNGSGKTTFIKLLCRLYDPTEGEILLNGIDIRKYNYLDYMMIFSIVFQDFKLFSLKLAENVASTVKYDEKRVKECLEKAGFLERLQTLEHGLETYLYKDCDKEGVHISGGEAQKIAIARALYKDAPFIILDEPTAALDPVAEAEIYSKFDEIAGDKTAVYISHRLSSCKFCDEIMVFHEGTVVQQGIHAELVANKDGKYYELWNAQAQYYTNVG